MRSVDWKRILHHIRGHAAQRRAAFTRETGHRGSDQSSYPVTQWERLTAERLGCRSCEKASLLARREEAGARWCTCADGTPPWLRRVNLCYATATGAMCEERESAYPGHGCDCMSWEREDLFGADITPPLDPDRHLIYDPSAQYDAVAAADARERLACFRLGP